METTMKALVTTAAALIALSTSAMSAQPTAAQIAAAHAKMQTLLQSLPNKGTTPKTAAAANSVVGWNVKQCVGSFVLHQATDELIAAVNSDGTTFFVVGGSDVEFASQAELIAACEHGSYQIHITDTNGDWDAVFVPHP
jgi:hypothetical protein